MALIKSSHSPRYCDCRHVEESAQHALSWMTRSRPGIKRRMPVRTEKNVTRFDLKSYQPH